MDLIPKGRISVLDAGARDGHLSILLADHFEIVTALDQKKTACAPPQGHNAAGRYHLPEISG
jgi:hypothetical protein